MKKTFFSGLFITLLLIYADAKAATIIQPHDGDTYFVGQKLTVELQTSQDENIDKVFIISKSFDWEMISSPPYKYETTINKPVDGQEKIGIRIIFKDDTSTILSTYIYVKLPNDLELKGIVLGKELSVVTITPSKNYQYEIKADGVFSNGKQYPINSYSQTSYKSLDESIVKVDSAGVMTGIYPGETNVIVSAGNISKTLKVIVDYEIDPVKGITAIASEKYNEVKWDKSPYEGDVVSGYKVYRSEGELGKYGVDKIMIGNVSTGISSFVDTQITAGVKYYYSVEAFSQKYNSGSSMKGLWILPSASPPPAIQ
jgi:hypothetical protein